MDKAHKQCSQSATLLEASKVAQAAFVQANVESKARVEALEREKSAMEEGHKKMIAQVSSMKQQLAKLTSDLHAASKQKPAPAIPVLKSAPPLPVLKAKPPVADSRKEPDFKVKRANIASKTLECRLNRALNEFAKTQAKLDKAKARGA